MRVKLTAYYRIFAQLGQTELVYNCITLHLQPEGGADDNDGPTFLINPFDLTYAKVCASNLVEIDPQGNVRRVTGQPDWSVNPTGFIVHAATHASIPGAHCMMHIHIVVGMTVAYAHGGLSIDNFYATQLHGKAAYHDFEDVTVHADEGPHLVRNTGDKPAVVLCNHRLLAWGGSTVRAFAVLQLPNRTCEIRPVSTSMGSVLKIPEAIARGCARDSLRFNPNLGAGEDVFAALTRTIDRIGSSYRT